MGPVPQPGSGGRRGTPSCPGELSINDLQLESERLLNASLAENTRKAYSTGLNSFERFRNEFMLPKEWPPSVATVVSFIAWLSLNGCTHNTARLYVSAIAFQCKVKNLDDNTGTFIVRKTLEGLKRSGALRKTRLPITRELLTSVISTLPSICVNLFEARLFIAAFCLAFSAFLRVSEVTAVNKKNHLHALRISDVKIDQKGEILSLFVRHSKSDQLGLGSHLTICRSTNNICPVRRMSLYLEQRPLVDGPLFCHLDGSPLTRYQFSAVLKKCLIQLQPQYSLYTSHSFRIGAATAAAMAGYSSEVIKKSGRWRSNAFQLYVRSDKVVVLPKLV